MNTDASSPLPSTPADLAFFGIDVSKATLDICLLRTSGKPIWSQFDNSSAGHARLLAWATAQAKHARRRFCLEATGSYSLGAALHLHEAGEIVSVVNPAHIKYSRPDGAAGKTDKAAARQIADFARLHQPAAWTPPAPEMRRLVALVRHLDDLTLQQAHLKGRLADPGLDAVVRDSLNTVFATLMQQIAAITAQIDSHIDGHPSLRQSKELLESIPGIGETTARRLLAEMPAMSECASAQSAAAYAGLSPKEHRSGTSVHKPTRLSKAGNKHLRQALYFPAIAALRYNERIRVMAERMKAAGKAKMVIVGAAMRKLLMIAYGVLKSGQPFNPEIAKRRPNIPPAQSLTT